MNRLAAALASVIAMSACSHPSQQQAPAAVATSDATQMTFRTGGGPPGTAPDGSPSFGANYVAADKRGTLWFTIYNDDALGEISADGIRKYPLPKTATPHAGPFYIATNPVDGSMWFTQARVGKVATFDPCNPAKIVEYAVTPNLEWGLTVAHGSVWVAVVGPNAIAQVDPATHKVALHVLPTHGGHPEFVAAGPDGRIWFTEAGYGGFPPGSKIGALDPASGKIVEYVLPTKESSPQQIVAGPDGNMWFTEENSNEIGKIDLHTSKITEYQVPGQTGETKYLIHIAAGPKGSNTLWFTELGGYVNSISTSGTFGKPQHVDHRPFGIAAGADNRMWIAQSGTTGTTGSIAHLAVPGIAPGTLAKRCR